MAERGGYLRAAIRSLKAARSLARGDGLRAMLIRGGAGSVALRSANALLQLLTTALLARSLSVADFGIYAFVLATISLLAIPAHAGVPTLIVRLTATYQVNGQWSLLVGLWKRSRQLLMIVSIGVMLLAVGFFASIGALTDPANRVMALTLAASLLIVPIKSIAESRSAALRGLGRIVVGQMPEQLIRPFMLALLLLLCIVIPVFAMSAPTAMTLHVIAALAAMLFATAALSRSRPAGCIGALPEYRQSEWLRAVGPLSLLAGAQVVLQQTGSVLLGAISGVEAVGQYRIAIQCGAVVSFGLIVATTVLSPHLARLTALGDHARAQSVITGSARLVFAAALLLTVLFAAFGEAFILIFFGDAYVAAYLPMVIVCLGLLIKAAAGPGAAVLTMSGHERDAFLGVATATVANIVLSIALIPLLGVLGAAVASALAFGVWAVQLTRLAYQRTGIDTTVLGFWRRREREAGTRT